LQQLWQKEFEFDEQLSKKASRIKLLLLDVDGVLTDGCIRLNAEGEETKVFNALDGHGIKMLQASGVDVAIITARNSDAVAHRMDELGVKYFYQGQKDKRIAFTELIAELGIDSSQAAFVGDDVIDLCVMRQCGLAITVPNGHSVVKQLADWQTYASGGKGAVRNVCDLLMIAQGTYNKMIEQYLV
jgi:3-deoxy-D-manno-octulosonate 8-phosphate phosphatase (KDO 8-P phosphatase)